MIRCRTPSSAFNDHREAATADVDMDVDVTVTSYVWHVWVHAAGKPVNLTWLIHELAKASSTSLRWSRDESLASASASGGTISRTMAMVSPLAVAAVETPLSLDLALSLLIDTPRRRRRRSRSSSFAGDVAITCCCCCYPG